MIFYGYINASNKARISAKLLKVEDNVAHWRVGYADGSTKTIKHVWKLKVKK